MPHDLHSQPPSQEEEPQAKRAPAQASGVPQFGKLLIVLAFAVAIVVALTFGSMAYYSH